MWKYIFFQIYVFSCIINKCNSISSAIVPFTNYQHSIELQSNVADLWWTVNDDKQEIIFELHIKTTGWVALGISPGKILFENLFIE